MTKAKDTKDAEDAAEEKAKEEKAEDSADTKRIDETVPGGRYKVGNEFVDASGEKVK